MLTALLLGAIFGNKPWVKRALLSAILSVGTFTGAGNGSAIEQDHALPQKIHAAHQERGR